MSDTGGQRHSDTGRPTASFRNLVAWQRGMELAEAALHPTAEMPATARFGLTATMRRAAVAVPSHVADGYARGNSADFLRLLGASRGSPAELSTQLELASRVGILKPPAEVLGLVEEQARILGGLIRAVERRERIDA